MEDWVQNQSLLMWIAAAVGIAAVAYSVLVARAWLCYGQCGARRMGDEGDPLLERFMPEFEVREWHHIEVAAPAPVTNEAARTANLSSSAIIRAIFRTREWVLGAAGATRGDAAPEGLVAWARSMGWGVLLDIPGRAIVFGAVTQPWEKTVVFRAIPPEQFAGFHEPGYVKIVWTLRVDPTGAAASRHFTETRAIATDAAARARFRRYWAFFSPGIAVIRQIAVRLVKSHAERVVRAHSSTGLVHRH